ncbi:MAG TPA: ATP-binding protein, partial [Burkholderiaceae bacterium]
MEAGEEELKAQIPPMILQPLLENAIKHGIRTLADGGMIEVRVTQRNGWLHIEVENPMDADAGTPQGTGTGLENIRRRCAALYGDRARVQWGSQAPGRFAVSLTLPFESNP